MFQPAPKVGIIMTKICSSAKRIAERDFSELGAIALSLAESSSTSIAKETSSKSRMFYVASSGRVERLCSVLEEGESPGVFLFHMGIPRLQGRSHASERSKAWS